MTLIRPFRPPSPAGRREDRSRRIHRMNPRALQTFTMRGLRNLYSSFTKTGCRRSSGGEVSRRGIASPSTRGGLPHNSLPGAVMMSKSLAMLFMGVGGVAALLATSGAVNSQEDGGPAAKGGVPKGAARKFGGPGRPRRLRPRHLPGPSNRRGGRRGRGRSPLARGGVPVRRAVRPRGGRRQEGLDRRRRARPGHERTDGPAPGSRWPRRPSPWIRPWRPLVRVAVAAVLLGFGPGGPGGPPPEARAGRVALRAASAPARSWRRRSSRRPTRTRTAGSRPRRPPEAAEAIRPRGGLGEEGLARRRRPGRRP